MTTFTGIANLPNIHISETVAAMLLDTLLASKFTWQSHTGPRWFVHLLDGVNRGSSQL
jgi:hypothetical protein